MKQSLLTFLLLLMSPMVSITHVNAAPENITPATTGIQWQAYDLALQAAKRDKRPVYIQFHANWCPYCKKLAAESYTRTDVQKLLNEKFVPVQILDNSKESYTIKGQNYTVQDLLVKFKVSGFPTLVFLTSDGKPIGIIPGYVEADDFKILLEFIANEAYLSTDFDIYRQQQRPL